MSKQDSIQEEKDLSVNNTIGIILKESHGYVDIEHGGNTDGDYIWHFMPKATVRMDYPDDLFGLWP